MLKNKEFLILLAVIFILHALTYPSIHHIIDEQIYLDISKNICNGNFSDFFGFIPNKDYNHNTPLYNVILCITSPIHGFNVEKAEIITYLFFVLLIIGWYYSIPKDWKVDKNKFTLLLFANSLLWVYSFRVLLDVPLAFFLSLGMLNLYLFFEYNKKKNYYVGAIFTSLALFTKESAVLFLPIFFIYFLFKKEKKLLKWILLILPLIPFCIFSVLQFISGFPLFNEFRVTFKPTTNINYSHIPYSKFPTIIFIIGVFGPGIILWILSLKNMNKRSSDLKRFVMFFLIVYLVWEIFFDFLVFANSPRYHTFIIPFITLTLSIVINDNKNSKRLFYLTLIYLLLTGFLVSYYFHIQVIEIWKIPLLSWLKK